MLVKKYFCPEVSFERSGPAASDFAALYKSPAGAHRLCRFRAGLVQKRHKETFPPDERCFPQKPLPQHKILDGFAIIL
jgi:hypothetical protein